MLTTSETARALGVSEQRIRRAIKKTGMRWRLQKEYRGGAYLFSPDDVIALAQLFKVRQLGYLRATLAPETHDHERTHAT